VPADKNQAKKSSQPGQESATTSVAPKAAQIKEGWAVYHVPSPVKTNHPFDVNLWVDTTTPVDTLAQQLADQLGLSLYSITKKPRVENGYVAAGNIEKVPKVYVGEVMFAELWSEDLEFAQKGPIQGVRPGNSSQWQWSWTGIKVKRRAPEDSDLITLTLRAWCETQECQAFSPMSVDVLLHEPWPERVQRRALHYLNLSTAFFEAMKLWLVALLAALVALSALIHVIAKPRKAPTHA
jgi:hypothetical protein